jgi:ornithine racemase
VTAPRLEIDYATVEHNARVLVDLLAPRGIHVTGIAKAALGSPEVAGAMLRAGVSGLGDSRVANLRRLRAIGPTSLTLIRSPMLSEVADVVRTADISLNTELTVLEAL